MVLSLFALGAHLELLVWSLLAFVGILGLTAILSPRCFASLAQRGGKWVDTDRLVQAFDKRIDIDQIVIRNGRAFGVLVVLAAVILAVVFGQASGRSLPF